MIIYTNAEVGMFEGEMTPAQKYVSVTDFAQILNEIANGNIPTNSGVPFTCVWKETEDESSWLQMNNPNYNPWANMNR